MRKGLFLLLLLIVSSAFAEERCVERDTPRQCLQRLIATRAYESAQAQVASANTGPSPVTSSPVRSAVKDFLSSASAHLDGSSVKEGDKALVLDYNLPGTILGASRQVNLEARLADAVASPAAATASAGNATETAAIQQLGRGDDVEVALSFNPVTQRFGRDVKPHRRLLDSMLLAVMANSLPATAAVPATSYDTTFAQSIPDTAARAAAIAEFETAANGALSPAAAQIQTDLSRLVDHQPQLFVSGRYHRRSPLVGPKEHAVRATWEIDSGNVNAFRAAEGRECEANGRCLTALQDFLARQGKEHAGARLSLAVEYRVTSQNNPTPDITPQPTAELASRTFTYHAVLGREVTSFVSGRQGRFDLAFDYDGHTKTHGFTTTEAAGAATARAAVLQPQLMPPSTTKFSTAATFTQPFANGLSVPMAIAWVDRLQWFPGPAAAPGQIISPAPPGKTPVPFSTHQRGFEAHFGIRYQVPQFSPQRPQQPSRDCCCK